MDWKEMLKIGRLYTFPDGRLLGRGYSGLANASRGTDLLGFSRKKEKEKDEGCMSYKRQE